MDNPGRYYYYFQHQLPRSPPAFTRGGFSGVSSDIPSPIAPVNSATSVAQSLTAGPSFHHHPLPGNIEEPPSSLTACTFDFAVFDPFSPTMSAGGPSGTSGDDRQSPAMGTPVQHPQIVPPHRHVQQQQQQEQLQNHASHHQPAYAAHGHPTHSHLQGLYAPFGVPSQPPHAVPQELRGPSAFRAQQHAAPDVTAHHNHGALHHPQPTMQESQSYEDLFAGLYGNVDMSALNRTAQSTRHSPGDDEQVSVPPQQTTQEPFSTRVQNPYPAHLSRTHVPDPGATTSHSAAVNTPANPFGNPLALNEPAPAHTSRHRLVGHSDTAGPTNVFRRPTHLYLRIPFHNPDGQPAVYNAVITSDGRIGIPPGLSPLQQLAFVRQVQIAYTQAAQTALAARSATHWVPPLASPAVPATPSQRSPAEEEAQHVGDRTAEQEQLLQQLFRESSQPVQVFPATFQAMQQASLGVLGGTGPLPQTSPQVSETAVPHVPSAATPSVPPVPRIPPVPSMLSTAAGTTMPTPITSGMASTEQLPDHLPLTAPTPNIQTPSPPFAFEACFPTNPADYLDSEAASVGSGREATNAQKLSTVEIFHNREAFLASDKPLLVTIGDRSFNLHPMPLHTSREGLSDYGYVHDSVIQASIGRTGSQDVHLSLVVRFPTESAGVVERSHHATPELDARMEVEHSVPNDTNCETAAERPEPKGKGKGKAKKKTEDEDERMDLDDPEPPQESTKRKRTRGRKATTNAIASSSASTVSKARTSDGPSKRTRRAQSKLDPEAKSPATQP